MSGATATVPSPDQSIPREHLAMLQVRKVIFHDVPRKVRGLDAQVTLSETTCALNPGKVTLLKDKLIRVLSSSAAYDLELNPQGQSSIPSIVESATGASGGDKHFVSSSQEMAVALLEHQPVPHLQVYSRSSVASLEGGRLSLS
jgi:hypothetical protein